MMRKLLIVALVIFTVAFAVGFSVDTVTAKGGGGSSNCYYTCSCNGVPLYCCTISGVTNCKVALFSPIQCTQQAGC